jgi:tRNA modification GTPase
MISNIGNGEIIALATPPGTSAIAIIRLSGEQSIEITNQIFKGKNLTEQLSHSVHFGKIQVGDRIIDEVLVSIFKSPHSFTKENSVEISCHGSMLIVRKIIQACLDLGVKYAKPGEFTQRAFLNGRFDLTQAEAVADLITADSDVAHASALKQMRGGFSSELKQLREKLVWFASLIELELDFGEEDVEFANRKDLNDLVNSLLNHLITLIQSFQNGNVIKNGIPVVIAGKPNAGKSTLLNALLNEEKAIVSEIPGTTRDFIEDNLVLNGLIFRFTDTAGLRKTQDEIEKLGVARTHEKIKQASLLLYLFDCQIITTQEIKADLEEINQPGIPLLLVGNKADSATTESIEGIRQIYPETVFISARQKTGLDELKAAILQAVQAETFRTGNVIVTNIRHFESLVQTQNSLVRVQEGLKNHLTGDLIAMDIRHALYHLGEITGEITTEDLLETIFSKFCIGK